MKGTSARAAAALAAALLSGSFPAAGTGPRVEETVLEAAFDVDPGGRLTVDVPDADLELTASDDGRVEIVVVLSAQAEDLPRARERFESMRMTADGDRRAVTLSAGRPRMSWNWGFGHGYSIVARITLPERFDLDLSTSDGDVRIGRIDGTVKVKTSDGDVRLEAARGPSVSVVTSDGDLVIGELASREVELSTSDGDVSVRGIDAGAARIRTSDGDIRVRGLRGPLSAATGDGDIRVEVDDLGALTLESGDGDVTVLLPPGAGAELELRAESVRIDSELGFDGARESRRAEGSLGGGGPLLRVRTRDGTATLAPR